MVPSLDQNMDSISTARIKALLADLEDSPEKEAVMKEIIIDELRTLPKEERKAILRNFVREEPDNWQFLLDYAPELHKEAFPIQ